MIKVAKLITGEKLIGFTQFHQNETGDVVFLFRKPYLLEMNDKGKFVIKERYNPETDDDKLPNLAIQSYQILYITDPNQKIMAIYNKLEDVSNVVALNATLTEKVE